MDIKQLLTGKSPESIIVARSSNTVAQAVAILASNRIGAVPIVEDNEVVGIFSERDLTYRIADEGQVCLKRTVGEVMTAPAITVSPETSVDDALALMTKRRIRHLPVLKDGQMCGFVSIGDMVKNKMDEVKQEAAAMRQYITAS